VTPQELSDHVEITQVIQRYFYHDQHVRTDAGWRIAERRFHQTRSVGELLPIDRVKTYDTPPWL